MLLRSSIFLLLIAAVPAEAVELYTCSTRWLPDNNELKFLGAAEDAMSIGIADDGSEAIQRAVVKGPNDIAQVKLHLFNKRLDAARITFEIFLPHEFGFSVAGHKLPLGFWGGRSDSMCMAGGCPVSQQDGFSVRLTNDAGAVNLYSYHLNRGTQVELSGSQYGKVFHSGVNLPLGEWVSVSVVVKLNRPGYFNGEIWLYLAGEEVLHQTGLLFRNTWDWWIRGPLLTDLWGGNIYLWGSQSPKDQKMWYRDYTIESLSTKPSCD
ncbi:polysaccharide lyase [Corallincola platygyrae]|uniref:Polysaccharide lyase n=1 Tax=Corallincola platygyrae TaxID=1193278 RepID=A0ABW4XP05_9GAMM